MFHRLSKSIQWYTSKKSWEQNQSICYGLVLFVELGRTTSKVYSSIKVELSGQIKKISKRGVMSNFRCQALSSINAGNFLSLDWRKHNLYWIMVFRFLHNRDPRNSLSLENTLLYLQSTSIINKTFRSKCCSTNGVLISHRSLVYRPHNTHLEC